MGHWADQPIFCSKPTNKLANGPASLFGPSLCDPWQPSLVLEGGWRQYLAWQKMIRSQRPRGEPCVTRCSPQKSFFVLMSVWVLQLATVGLQKLFGFGGLSCCDAFTRAVQNMQSVELIPQEWGSFACEARERVARDGSAGSLCCHQKLACYRLD